MSKKIKFSPDGKYSLVLQVLLVIYIAVAAAPPPALARWMSTSLGHVVAVVVALAAFPAAGPITGMLALVAAYVLLERSAAVNPGPVELHQESTPRHSGHFAGNTLEERVVANMVPPEDGPPTGPASYLPVLNPMHGLGSPVRADS